MDLQEFFPKIFFDLYYVFYCIHLIEGIDPPFDPDNVSYKRGDTEEGGRGDANKYREGRGMPKIISRGTPLLKLIIKYMGDCLVVSIIITTFMIVYGNTDDGFGQQSGGRRG